MEFSTYDADNDKKKDLNCADKYGGGFWWYNCGWQNINGHYSGSNYKPYHILWWGDCNYLNFIYRRLKTTQMMIRPAA